MTFRGRGSTELWNKGKWTGRAGREMSQWSKGFFFPQTQVSMWRCLYFLSYRHSVAWVFLLWCLPSWVFEENSENWRFHSVYDLKPHAVLLSLWLKAPCCVTEFVFGYQYPGYEDTWVGFGHHSLSLRVCPGWAVVMVGEQWNSWAQWSSENKWRV